MSDPFLAEIRLFSFPFAPRGWASCNGQVLPISQNQALFSLLGTAYGGDGKTTFALPDLRGRAPVHPGYGVTLGQSAGEESHTLSDSELPAHTHQVSAGGQAAVPTPSGNVWGTVAGQSLYADATSTTMNASAIGSAGQGQPHPNMQPSLVMNFCMALQGIYPSRN